MSSSSSSSSPQRTALVLGGSGFISGHCVEHLLAYGKYDVTILTRGQTADAFGDRVSRLVADRDDSAAFTRALDGRSFDLVVDCIAFEPADFESLFALIKRGKLKVGDTFVFISTDSVYQVCERDHKRKKARQPIVETETTLRDVSVSQLERIDRYGYRKLLCERALATAAAEMPLPYISLRLPDVMGENEVPWSRHYKYQALVAAGTPVELGKDAETALSFVWVQDVARLCIALHEAVLSGHAETLLGRAFNVGSRETPTLAEYVERIGTILAQPATIDRRKRKHSFLPSVECGPIDMGRLCTVLHAWEPTPYDKWMKRTVRWYARNAKLMGTSDSSSSSSGSSNSNSSGSNSG
eukprot:c53744_g1_i1.p1 GENE.c53744_g1_i1~~c53744_g1_i1.p1  ORF type:complete len:355 (+),score=52.30 c53744_g1_i1:119-1183(+)